MARADLGRFLDESRIAYVDALPPLRQAVGKEKLYYPGPADMHPGKNGYKVIGDTAAELLRRLKSNGR